MIHSFASDNNSMVSPEIMEALHSVNIGFEVGYGADPYTREAEGVFRQFFGDEVQVFFVFNGTGANVLSLSCLSDSYHAILCTEAAHINEDECGAPEKFTGSKLWDFFAADAKLNPDMLTYTLANLDDEHRVQPKVISITQATEFGTLYSVEEVRELAAFAHKNGMYLHMDGARIANAAVSLGLSFRQFTRDAGVDAVSFGGTKNGLMYGEAVLFFNPELARKAKFLRKQSMQLASKMRFISAQFTAYLKENVWHRNALHANTMAKKLADGIRTIPGTLLFHPVQANGVFVQLPPAVIARLREKHFFYIFDEKNHVARFMCSFNTPESEVVKLVEDIGSVMASV
jgi:threonine aldolase